MFSFINSYSYDSIVDWLEAFVTHQIVFAPILLLIIEESGIPLPVPGDIVIAYTGYQVSKGTIAYANAFLILLFSVLIGSTVLFFLARKYGNTILKNYGDFLHIDVQKLAVVEKQFKKFGPLVIIFGRHIPGFRVPITIFSGMSNISYTTFIISTFVSVILWIPFYLSVGARLGPKTEHLFHGHSGYYYLLLIPFIIFILLAIFTRFRRKKTKTHAAKR